LQLSEVFAIQEEQVEGEEAHSNRRQFQPEAMDVPAWTTSSPPARCALEGSGDVPHMSLNRQKMNPAVKQLWLEAPRSGNYKQGLQSFTGKIFVVWAFSATLACSKASYLPTCRPVLR